MANQQDDTYDYSDQYDDPELMIEHDVPADQMEDLQRTLADNDEETDENE